MSPSRIRYVTACQQMLALGVVLTALAPAAAVLSLDVVHESPAGGVSTPGATGLGGGLDPVTVLDATAQRRSRVLARERRSAALALSADETTASVPTANVPTKAVEPTVTEVPLEPASTAPTAPTAARRTTGGSEAVSEVVSKPQAIAGYGGVGVTWAPGTSIPEGGIDVAVRTRTDGTWSTWQPMEYHDDHGADPGTAEAAHERPGTDESLVGDVDDVQVKVDTGSEPLPSDLSLAVIDPGTAKATATELPALEGAAPVDRSEATGQGGIALRAATTGAVQPTIYSRAQWGADERVREQGSPQYGVIKGGFVHHTVNANDYTADEVPGIIRSIYAYHVKSRGWRDIGYNFLVDRFGRIWEGRYGGIDKPVIGAHTSGYNGEAFAMAAIGNFDLVQPPAEMLQAYGALFGWKLAISGVSAAATNVAIAGKTFAGSINGHRDAGQTACPGKYLYAQLPAIRSYATAAQGGTTFGPGWTGRDLGSDLAGTAYPDLVVRRAADGKGVLLTTGGLTRFAAPTTISKGWKSAKRIVLSPDLTGDGRPDLVFVGKAGDVKSRAGKSSGSFGKARSLSKQVRGVSLLTPVGDLDRNGRNDLVGVDATGRLHVFGGKGKRTFTDKVVKGSWKGYNLLVGAGDVDGDGRADLMARSRKGKLFLFHGTKSGVGKRSLVSKGWTRFDTIVSGGDYTGDGRADLVVRRAKTGDVYVVPGLGAGRFGAQIGPVANLGKLDWVTGAPLNGDSAADLVARRGNRLQRIDNAGTSELATPVETNLDLRSAVQVLNAGDFDRDGTGDVIARQGDGLLLLYPGTGGGQFATGVPIGTGFGSVAGLAAVGDRTGDGTPDLVGTVNGASYSYPGHGRAPLGAAAPAVTPYLLAPSGTDLSGYDWVTPISDGNGDGVPDLLVRRAGSQLFLLPGSAKSLGTPRLLGDGMQAYDLAG